MTTKHEIIAVHERHPDWAQKEIVKYLNCAASHVSMVLRDAGIVLLDSRRSAPAVEIPAWVPPSLHDRYLEIADRRGEFAAAADARHAKRAMA